MNTIGYIHIYISRERRRENERERERKREVIVDIPLSKYMYLKLCTYSNCKKLNPSVNEMEMFQIPEMYM